MNPNYIAISNTQYTEFVRTIEIIYCKAAGSYSEIFLMNKLKLTVSKNLLWVEQRLSSETFLRIHKSYLINLYFISKIFHVENKLFLLNGKDIPFSKERKKQLFEKVEELNSLAQLII